MRPSIICLVTDRTRLAGRVSAEDAVPLLKLIASATQAGVDLVQIREPDLSDKLLLNIVRKAVELTNGTETRIVVNDRVDIAVAAGASGVHLKSRGIAAERVRTLIPSGWIVGRSVHELEEAIQVTASDALDYIIVGPVFKTTSKPGVSPVGHKFLEDVAKRVDVPVLAIGGVTAQRAGLVSRAGLAGLAGITAFVGLGDDLEKQVKKLRIEFDKGRS